MAARVVGGQRKLIRHPECLHKRRRVVADPLQNLDDLIFAHQTVLDIGHRHGGLSLDAVGAPIPELRELAEGIDRSRRIAFAEQAGSARAHLLAVLAEVVDRGRWRRTRHRPWLGRLVVQPFAERDDLRGGGTGAAGSSAQPGLEGARRSGGPAAVGTAWPMSLLQALKPIRTRKAPIEGDRYCTEVECSWGSDLWPPRAESGALRFPELARVLHRSGRPGEKQV
ncbi:MAG: hypothetical protein R3F17_16525 [Planctomycetota bacterium]